MRLLSYLLCLMVITTAALSREKDRAPFDVEFGEAYNVSKHDTIRRLWNIRSVNLKNVTRPEDTKDLRAEICDVFGLQNITWRSHVRSIEEAAIRHKEISRELTKQYGKPSFKRSSAFWKAHGFIVVAKIRSIKEQYQNQVRYFGPQDEACFNQLMINQQKNK